MLIPTRGIQITTAFKGHFCITVLGTVSHHLVGIADNGSQSRRRTVKPKANRIENRCFPGTRRARNAEHAAICKVRTFKINRPFTRQGIDIAEFNLLNLHRFLLCVLVRLGDSFVKQTNKFVVLILDDFGIFVFLGVRRDEHSEIIFFRILLCRFHAIVKAIHTT